MDFLVGFLAGVLSGAICGYVWRTFEQDRRDEADTLDVTKAWPVGSHEVYEIVAEEGQMFIGDLRERFCKRWGRTTHSENMMDEAVEALVQAGRLERNGHRVGKAAPAKEARAT